MRKFLVEKISKALIRKLAASLRSVSASIGSLGLHSRHLLHEQLLSGLSMRLTSVYLRFHTAVVGKVSTAQIATRKASATTATPEKYMTSFRRELSA